MDIDAYLDRLGVPAGERPPPDLDTLRLLHRAHLRTVPFENLDVHLGERLQLADEALLDKIVRRRRGGICYELNGAFAVLLRALGFEVSLLAARVFTDEGELGIPFDHLVLRVDLDEPWLADVGFGAHSDLPLRLDERGVQQDPAGEFRVVPVPGPDGDLDVYSEDKPAYRLERRAHRLDAFRSGAWWHSTSPLSPFTQGLMCTLRRPDGRITHTGERLIETTGDAREVREIGGDAEALELLRAHFGVELDRLPSVLHPAAP